MRAGTFHERSQYFLKMWICGYQEIVTFTPRGLASNLHGPTVTNSQVLPLAKAQHLFVPLLPAPALCLVICGGPCTSHLCNVTCRRQLSWRPSTATTCCPRRRENHTSTCAGPAARPGMHAGRPPSSSCVCHDCVWLNLLRAWNRIISLLSAMLWYPRQ